MYSHPKKTRYIFGSGVAECVEGPSETDTKFMRFAPPIDWEKKFLILTGLTKTDVLTLRFLISFTNYVTLARFGCFLTVFFKK